MGAAKEAVITPIKSSRAFEQVSAQIKKLIFDGVFRAGDKLPSEAELASVFGVGRQTIREALRILELSGFIVIQKGGGGGAIVKDTISATISTLFLDTFRLENTSLEELTIARVEIERVVLKYAVANADAQDIQALRQNVAEARAKSDQNQMIVDENIAFHQLLAKASKNKLFVIVVEAITATVRHCMSQMQSVDKVARGEKAYDDQLVKSRNTIVYHKGIVDAIEAGDVDSATRLLEEHLTEVKQRLIKVMGQST
jgi:DNA-binding FadR family transcriptional regulator